MNPFKRVVITLFIAIAPMALFAQATTSEQKTAHINVNQLLQMHPKMATIKTSLEKYTADFQKQMKLLTSEYQSKLKEYQSGVDSMSQARRRDSERYLMQLQERIENYQTESQDELNQQEKELLDPLLKEIQTAIEAVAKEQGFTYVMDTSSGVVLYADKSADIMSAVKKKLNI